MLLRKIVVVCAENYTKHLHALFGGNLESHIVSAAGTYSNNFVFEVLMQNFVHR